VLGLYDSGLGGLTVLAALRKAGVDADVVYFADQAHVPYGDRTDAELYGYLEENFRLLEAHGSEAIVMACNTSCAVAARRGGFPATRLPVLDLIGNAAAALRDTRFARIAVFATAATVRSGAYRAAIAAQAPHIEVIEIAAPALVPLVEEGLAATDRARDEVSDLCRALPPGIEAIVYGCTHYPLLDGHFARALRPGVARIDPASTQAAAAAALVRRCAFAPGSGATHYLTNGDLTRFEANVRAWTGDLTGSIAAVALEDSALPSPSRSAAPSRV
jgi:glutamate racemase